MPTTPTSDGADTPGARRWYLIQCKSRQELRALEHLERQGFECLLPLHCVERLLKGQLRRTGEPLFPGYLFIHLDSSGDNWLPLRSTRGVLRLVSFNGRATPVADELIERLKHRQSAPSPALRGGDRVVIDAPGMRQLEAVFLAKDGEARVILLLKLLQRDSLVKVPLDSLSLTNP